MANKILESKEFEQKVLEIINKSITIPMPVSKRYTILKDGWIHDAQLNVEWGPSSDKYMRYGDAIEYCTKNGGRLPTREELQSIVDYDKYNPAIDTNFFKDTKSNWYWTSSPVATVDSARWVVYFDGGLVSWNDEGSYGCVRPVRPCQCG